MTDPLKTEYKASFKKLKAIIISCENREQLKIARNCQISFNGIWRNHIKEEDQLEIDMLFMQAKSNIISIERLT